MEQKELLHKITPGTWFVKNDSVWASIENSEHTSYICGCGDSVRLSNEEIKSNALLISQAPQLLRDNIQLKEEVEKMKKVLATVLKDFEQWPCKPSTQKLIEETLNITE